MVDQPAAPARAGAGATTRSKSMEREPRHDPHRSDFVQQPAVEAVVADGLGEVITLPTLPAPVELTPPDLPVETVTLRTRHHDVPCTCPVCGSRTKPAKTTEECWGKRLIVRAEKVDAFRCDPCDYVKATLDAHIDFLAEVALPRMIQTRDRDTATILRQELHACRKVQQIRRTLAVP